MKNYRTLLKQEKWQLTSAMFLGAFALSASLLLLVFSAWLISSASTQPPILTLEVAIVSVRFFGISRGVFRYAGRLIDHNTALRIQGKLRLSIYETFATSPAQFTQSSSRGKLLTTIVQAIDSIHDVWIRITSPYLSSLFTSLVGIGVIHQICPPLVVPLSLVLAVTYLIPLLSMRFEPRRKKAHSQREQEGSIYEEMELLLSSLRESIVFHYYRRLYTEIVSSQKKLAKILKKKYLYQSANELRTSTLFGVTLFISLYYGVRELHTGKMPGVDFAVLALIPLAIFDPISAIPGSLVFAARARESAHEINSILTHASNDCEIVDNFAPRNENAEHVKSLELIDMRAVIGDSEFTPLSLHMRSGELAIISGKSGCGKSSLVNALIGQLPYEGEFLLNNVDAQPSLRSRFSVLLQDDHLFTTSLRENLLISNPALGDAEIWNLLEMVELRERFESDPKGLDTFIGSSIGVSTMPISAGEAQRIRFIRSLARPADLYIFDEPFEYLDRELISRILPKAFAYLNRTSTPMAIVISHIAFDVNSPGWIVHNYSLNADLNSSK
jgi:thiol reductant ABC exporter CydC subunit